MMKMYQFAENFYVLKGYKCDNDCNFWDAYQASIKIANQGEMNIQQKMFISSY